ncbi:DinB family protein [Actinomadura logoneensis]|uniref:DinB family protein n=1 Tax=Actinomadura logoneensis TaxID=2293572 RepID=A0A372JPW0_9ACTN|nr:DinB family protein [Actinomadura logoneensis]RFU42047.1 DinB family protein [Actinomadura logoneensis]
MERLHVPGGGDERVRLTGFLQQQRVNVHRKCDGLSDELAHKHLLAATSPLMSVAGVVSHLRWVEHWWFEHILLDEPERAPWSDEDIDAEFRVDDVPLARLLDDYTRQCARTDEIIASLPLDHPAAHVPQAPVGRATAGWMLGHMATETARHVGHLDIMRELMDGRTGH